MKKYVLIELDVDDWGAVDAEAYVRSRDMRGFMGNIRVADVTEALMSGLYEQDILNALDR